MDYCPKCGNGIPHEEIACPECYPVVPSECEEADELPHMPPKSVKPVKVRYTYAGKGKPTPILHDIDDSELAALRAEVASLKEENANLCEYLKTETRVHSEDAARLRKHCVVMDGRCADAERWLAIKSGEVDDQRLLLCRWIKHWRLLFPISGAYTRPDGSAINLSGVNGVARATRELLGMEYDEMVAKLEEWQ